MAHQPMGNAGISPETMQRNNDFEADPAPLTFRSVTQSEKTKELNCAVVSVAMPRSEWLLLETILVVLESAGKVDARKLNSDWKDRIVQIKRFIIEAERREAARINAMEKY